MDLAPEKPCVFVIDNNGVAVEKFEYLRDRVDLEVIKDEKTTDIAEGVRVASKLAFCDVFCLPPRPSVDAQDLITCLPKVKCILAETSDEFNEKLATKIQESNVKVVKTREVIPTDAKTPGPRAQHTWGLILALSRHIARDDGVLKRGGWQGTFAMGLPGKTLGLIGLDLPGQAVARIGVTAFAMKVKVWSTEELTQKMADEIANNLDLLPGTFQVVSKGELLRTSDVISLHEDLSRKNVGVIGRAELGLLKRTALFVNISRAMLVDEQALFETLEKGKIKGAALDTFKFEPLPPVHPWRSTKWGTEGRSEVVLTPDVAYAEIDVLKQYYEDQAIAVEKWLDIHGPE
ncbi:D-isomer specific 2-hydroxyacid dehydrogenase family protein [Ascosphaera apis ARSEF 7405]|uniref:D-isomer specific 2-hydroxyacid dehydrogenase family protein n=1 Tax=Ascosphaera apis ARSEF 7405 TaxID=392613 RepID=A0A167Z9W0_9EURO|nr:D-isomer specific 2-hydroxyacid dehydrogenase family protein [Ascosphaera apis ARSEF 7405]